MSKIIKYLIGAAIVIGGGILVYSMMNPKTSSETKTEIQEEIKHTCDVKDPNCKDGHKEEIKEVVSKETTSTKNEKADSSKTSKKETIKKPLVKKTITKTSKKA